MTTPPPPTSRQIAEMREQQRKAKEKNYARNGICPECGGRGAHWVNAPGFTFGLVPAGGFWTCPKFYGPDGRRINP